MKPPHIILSIGVTLILSSILSVSATVPSSPPAGMEAYPGGKFSRYFQNMIGTAPCAPNAILKGFDAGNTEAYGTKQCVPLPAPTDGSAFAGFNSSGTPVFTSTWLKSGTALYYNGGNVGIGTSTPAFPLEVNGPLGSTVSNGWATMLTRTYTNQPQHHGAFLGMRARGTLASPSYPIANDTLATFNGRDAIDGISSLTNYGGAFIQMSAAQNFTANAKGTHMYLGTTNINAALPTAKMMIEANGNVGIGTNTPTAKLEVTGVTKVDKIQLGNKVVLSGVGDAHGNDGWIRMMSASNPSSYGGYGLAADNLYAGNRAIATNMTVYATPTAPTDVANKAYVDANGGGLGAVTTVRTSETYAWRWPTALVTCNSDEIVLSGGGTCQSPPNGYMFIYTSIPYGNGWYVACDTPNKQYATAKVYAVCAKK